MVCKEDNPEELVSWGHNPTQQLAEAAAQHEVNDLSSGLSRGGRVTRRGMSLLADFGLAASDRFDIPPVKNPMIDTSQHAKDTSLYHWPTVKDTQKHVLA